MDMKENKSFLALSTWLSLVYLAIPMVLFLLNWVALYLSLPLVLLLVSGLAWPLCNRGLENDFATYTKKDWLCILMPVSGAALFAFMMGLTGNWQQHPDFFVRNDMFYNLAKEPWPVVLPDGKYFVYYFAAYLPVALFGKFLSWVALQWAFYLWTLAGLSLFTLQMYRKLGCKVWLFFGAFMLWQGLDIYPRYVFSYLNGDAFARVLVADETSMKPFIVLGNAGALKAYPHAMTPFFLVLSLSLFPSVMRRFGAYLGACAVLYSPLSSIFFLPCIAVLFIHAYTQKYASFAAALKPMFAHLLKPHAVAAVVATLVVFGPYYASMKESPLPDTGLSTAELWVRFLIYTFFKVGIVSILMYRVLRLKVIGALAVLMTLCIASAAFCLQEIPFKGGVVWGFYSVYLYVLAVYQAKGADRKALWLYLLLLFIPQTLSFASAILSIACGAAVWAVSRIRMRYSCAAALGACVAVVMLYFVAPSAFDSTLDKLAGKECRYSKMMRIYQPDGGSGLWWWYRKLPDAADMPPYFVR